jgi:hypothetical protein
MFSGCSPPFIAIANAGGLFIQPYPVMRSKYVENLRSNQTSSQENLKLVQI